MIFTTYFTMGIQVLVRARPLVAKEAGNCLAFEQSEAQRKICTTIDGRRTEFEYDRVFHGKSTQSDIFKVSVELHYGMRVLQLLKLAEISLPRSLQEVKHIVDAVLDGYNGSIMAYGQTSAGKSYTMFGGDAGNCQGIVPRAVTALCTAGAMQPGGCTLQISLSVLEVYNEKVKDLLNPSQDNLQVFQDAQGVRVPSLTAEAVADEAACAQLMATALSNRAVGATAINEASSRSHCLVVLLVERTLPDGAMQKSKLCLVVSAFGLHLWELLLFLHEKNGFLK